MGTTSTWTAQTEADSRCFGVDLLPTWSAPQIGLVRGPRAEGLRDRQVAGTDTMTADDQAPTRADSSITPLRSGEQAEPLDGAPSDEDLMLAFRDGDAAAFEQLVTRHKRGLYNFLLRSVHDRSRSDEMLQEVFLRVIRAKDRYQRTARFTTWIYTIARNLCVDESRRQKFRRTLPLEAKRRSRGGDDGQSILDVTEAQQVGLDAQSEAPKLRERVAAAIEGLPDDQREVFMMRQFGGLSFKQIGEAVGAPENTVKSRMRYALEKLRGDLGDIDPRATAIARKKVSTSG
jgi:RNA polymerase sigma-70 factor (ECF subfamily)